MDDFLGVVSGVSVGAYMLGVAYNGNAKKLLSLLKEDAGYIEFAIALGALYALHKYRPLGKVADIITVTAVTAVLLKAFETSHVGTQLNSFASGEKGIIKTAANVLGYGK